ncbi:MAG: hypothetical protein P0S96_08580 [Simkaniaceae bacterium]|nr:hypothetical protein [Candidatus Sacchlamyda saccharinae]
MNTYKFFAKAITLFAVLFCGISSKGYCMDDKQAQYIEEFCSFFYVDQDNSTEDTLRVSVPVAADNWFVIPMATIKNIENVGFHADTGENYIKAKIKFKNEYSQLNSILPSFQELLLSEYDDHWEENFSFGWGWKPPWTWSKCAKCKLSVNLFITGSVFTATVLAGVTGPGALAVAKAMIISKYGLAAWEAVKAVIFSEGVSSISKKICKATGKC